MAFTAKDDWKIHSGMGYVEWEKIPANVQSGLIEAMNHLKGYRDIVNAVQRKMNEDGNLTVEEYNTIRRNNEYSPYYD